MGRCTTGTDLYKRTMQWAETNLDAEGAELLQMFWYGTPWVVNAFTGRMAAGRERQMAEWCRDRFGDEAWPIHGRPGAWQRGGVTIHGWTWFGFKDRDMMERFQAVWMAPGSDGAA